MSRLEKKQGQIRETIQKAGRVRRGAEVGVWRGDTSAMLFEHFRRLHLTLVDSWALGSLPDSYSFFATAHCCDTEEGWSAVHQSVVDRFAGRRVSVIRGDAVSVAGGLDTGVFDFVYIDAAHDKDSVLGDVSAWWHTLRPGGVLCGDDYDSVREKQGYEGVKESVDSFAKRVQREVIHDWKIWGIVK